ncbi:hypothetical protein ACFL6I_11165 [candidate division KSB1 bacterium]
MAHWDKTQILEARLMEEGLIDIIGGKYHYKGRPIIHRNSPIDGGVYLGETGREAIVVDSVKYEKLRELYQKATLKALEQGWLLEDFILGAVYNAVDEAMPEQSEVKIRNLMKRMKVHADKKVALDVFLEIGIGVCRHTSVACGAVLEMFRNDGLIDGHISADRNYDPNYGSHAWCRYEKRNGEIWVLDNALGNFGRIEKVTGNFSEGKWDYMRPDDDIYPLITRRNDNTRLRQEDTIITVH